ncbi:MAG: ATP-binding protein [Bacteroidota bacterium]
MDNLIYLPRSAEKEVLKLASYSPAAVIVGPRQVGKTSLTQAIRNQIGKPSVYLDLERPRDLAKLDDLEALLATYPNHLIILDEIQRQPSLFPELRSAIDRNRVAGRFILLGSASPELIRDSSETLAGRVAYLELATLSYQEIQDQLDFRTHWFRGGFPLSLLAVDDEISSRWRDDFIRTYLERDLPQLGLNAEAVLIRRLWTMLAHCNGQLVNKNTLSKSLGISTPSITRYLDFLEHAFLIRRLRPFYTNLGKRLVKSPKLYLRDTGILHELLSIYTPGDLLGHPSIGASWENYVIEQLFAIKPRWAELYFYRTHGGAEIDIVITKADIPQALIEIKYAVDPSLSRGFYSAVEDLKAEKKFIIAPIEGFFQKKENIIVLGIGQLERVYQ